MWADHAHGCAKAVRNMGKSCAQMSEQSQTWEDIRPATTIVVSSPWRTFSHVGAEREHEGQPHEDRAVKAAETNKIRDYKPPPSTQAVHNIPMAFDVFGRWGEKAEQALKQAARRRLEKRDALRATRSEHERWELCSVGGEVKEQQQCSYETLRSTATALQGPKNLPCQVRPR